MSATGRKYVYPGAWSDQWLGLMLWGGSTGGGAPPVGDPNPQRPPRAEVIVPGDQPEHLVELPG